MEALRRQSLTSRALLVVALWAGFYVLALGLALGLAWIPIAQARYSDTFGFGAIAAGAGAITVLWALRPRWWFKKKKEEDRFEPLSREEAPELFAFAEQVAAKVGAKPPRKLYLSGGPNASAAVESRWLGLVRERMVAIGLPLLAFLEPDELGAVLAHEFGHHVGGDVALGPWVYRTRAAIGRAAESLEDSSFFLDLPFRAYGDLFLRASTSVSRQQELAADAVSAGAFGAQATAAALRKVHELGPLWAAYFAHDAGPAISAGARVPLIEGFRRFLAEKKRRQAVQRDIDDLASGPPSPWDSHPSLEERLAAVGQAGSRPPVLASGGCLHLAGGERRAEELWYARAISAPLRAAGWEELGPGFVIPEIVKALKGTALDPARTPPSALPSLLREGAALWDRVRPAGLDLLSPEAKRRRAQQLLTDWLSAALSHRGFVAQVRPGAALALVGNGEEVDPAALVEGLGGGALDEHEYTEFCAGVESRALNDG